MTDPLDFNDAEDQVGIDENVEETTEEELVDDEA